MEQADHDGLKWGMIDIKRLQFKDKALEEDFNEWYLPIELRIFRYVLLFGIVTYFVFIPLDIILYDEALTFQFFIGRLGIVGIIGIVYKLTFNYLKTAQHLQWFAISIATVAFLVNVLFTFFDKVDNYYFYTGNSVLIIFIFILLNIRFFSLIFLAIFYVATYLVVLKINFTYSYDEFIHQAYGTILMVVVGLIAKWMLEFQKRQNYLSNKMIEEQKEALQNNVKEKDKLVKILAEQNQELDAFNYSVSHDLKTPLRNINAFSKLLERRYKDQLDDVGLEYLEFISNGTNKMNNLITDLLAYSKIRHQELKYEKIDMTTLAKSVFEEETQSLEQQPVLIIDDLPSIKGDSILLTQVWNNLISNAIKYSSKRAEIQIKVSATQKYNSITYVIEDNGIGFDMKSAEALFEPFHRLHTEEEFKGTGIGLSLVSRIIKKHNGKIWAESTPNEGSTFYFSLPNL